MRENVEGSGIQAAMAQTRRIRLAAPTPAIVVEWPTGVFFGNYSICPCCMPSEAEGFVVHLATHGPMDWKCLCTAAEPEALALISRAQQWAEHGIRDLVFYADPRNRYCWHRCSFLLELRPPSLAFPVIENGWFHGWLAWPWQDGSSYEPRKWGASMTEDVSEIRHQLSNNRDADPSGRKA